MFLRFTRAQNKDLMISYLAWSFFLFTSKGCSWRLIPAHPRCPADCQYIGIVEFATLRPFNQYTEPCISFFCLILFTLCVIKSFAFIGCSWRLIPAYPRFADRHNDRAVEFTSSRAFYRYAELCILYNMGSSKCMLMLKLIRGPSLDSCHYG